MIEIFDLTLLGRENIDDLKTDQELVPKFGQGSILRRFNLGKPPKIRILDLFCPVLGLRIIMILLSLELDPTNGDIEAKTKRNAKFSRFFRWSHHYFI